MQPVRKKTPIAEPTQIPPANTSLPPPYQNFDVDTEASQLEPWATFMRSQPPSITVLLQVASALFV
jgi:hypothetical protein